MFTIEEFKSAISEEIRVARHLGTKITPDRLDWRPTPGQRSCLELMGYVATVGAAVTEALVKDDWGGVAAWRARSKEITLEGFDRAMADQEQRAHALLDGIPPEDLTGRQVHLPWGRSCSLGQALYESSLRFLIAYRMQLFLYAKQSGASELTFHDAWLGMDAPPEAGA